MANDIDISTAARNAAAAAIVALIDVGGAGSIKIYDGTKPAGPDTAVSTQTMLVSCALSATAFGAPSSGTVTANTITAGNPAANGTATWYRVFAGNGTTAVIDGTIGTSGSDINLGSTTISTGVPVTINSLTYTHP